MCAISIYFTMIVYDLSIPVVANPSSTIDWESFITVPADPENNSKIDPFLYSFVCYFQDLLGQW